MTAFTKITEQPSPYRHLEKMSIGELLTNINKEDKTVPGAVERSIPQIKKLVGAITDKMLAGGRLFYIGAGTSGRLAVVDASECPPTFGVPYGLVIAVIAGGDEAITKAIENKRRLNSANSVGQKAIEPHENIAKVFHPCVLVFVAITINARGVNSDSFACTLDITVQLESVLLE